jgi:hypothetical protein
MAIDPEEEIVIVVGGGPRPGGRSAQEDSGKVKVKVSKPSGMTTQGALRAALAAQVAADGEQLE